MSTGQVVLSINIGGVSRSQAMTRSGTAWTHDETLAAGKAGILSMRSGNTEGVITLGASHGVTTDDEVDVAWVGGGNNECRRRMTVASVDGTTITVEDGAGDNLPAEESPLVVGVRCSVIFAMSGSTLKMLSLFSTPPAGETSSRAMVDFMTSVPASVAAFDLNNNEPYAWTDQGPPDNPLGGSTVASIEMSSLTTKAPTVCVEMIYDASP